MTTPILFNGIQICGAAANRVQGPNATRRVQRAILPGVVGFRNYSLTGGVGPDTQIFIVRGRIISFSVQGVEQVIRKAQSHMNGRLYSFRSTSGTTYHNCELVDYRPIGQYQTAYLGGVWLLTLEVQGTIEQASP